ncbi:hypothetical protein GBA52_015173 [Prunus armeniaca]|nr:hypothetical protein GBA52_015173 [Prunus armeniaca]
MRIEILPLVLSNDSKVSGDDFEGGVHRGSGGFRILNILFFFFIFSLFFSFYLIFPLLFFYSFFLSLSLSRSLSFFLYYFPSSSSLVLSSQPPRHSIPIYLHSFFLFFSLSFFLLLLLSHFFSSLLSLPNTFFLSITHRGLSPSTLCAHKGSVFCCPRGRSWSPQPYFLHPKGSCDPSCPNMRPPLHGGRVGQWGCGMSQLVWVGWGGVGLGRERDEEKLFSFDF